MMGSNWPTVCPACGSSARIPVVWGMPGPEDFERAEAGEFALGGCCVPPDFGTVDYWACRECGRQFPVRPLVNDSPVGRLLEEISWEGNARPYRHGGRGRENVLTTEVFALLDWLPRQAFLGAVLAAAHGADQVRSEAAAEVEAMTVSVLPGDVHGVRTDGAPTPWSVQPDVRLESWRATVWVEAKRIRPPRSSPTNWHGPCTPCSPPPIGKFRCCCSSWAPLPRSGSPGSAPWTSPRPWSTRWPSSTTSRTCCRRRAGGGRLDHLDRALPAVRRATDLLDAGDPSVAASVRRMTDAVDRAIAWHS